MRPAAFPPPFLSLLAASLALPACSADPGSSGAGSATPQGRTAAIDGDTSHFDPIAGLVQAQALAGSGARLTGLRAAGVRRDGTLDLEASYRPAPSARYDFQREAPPPPDAPPLGAGGPEDGRWFQALSVEAYAPGQRRQVTRTGGGIGVRSRYVNQGLDLKEGETTGAAEPELPSPACPFARLWTEALTQGAPADAVAQISYEAEGYAFNIPGIFHRRYGPDCAPIGRGGRIRR